MAYKLRWVIESFFAWEKRHRRVYHLIARSPYSLMVQSERAYNLNPLAIYFHEQHGEKVPIRIACQLGIQILNETRAMEKKGVTNLFNALSKITVVHLMQKFNRTLLVRNQIFIAHVP